MGTRTLCMKKQGTWTLVDVTILSVENQVKIIYKIQWEKDGSKKKVMVVIEQNW